MTIPSTSIMKYASSNFGKAVQQCEILKDVLIPKFSSDYLKIEEWKILPFSIIVSQDCDLEQDFVSYEKKKQRTIKDVIVCQLTEPGEQLNAIASGISKQIFYDNDEDYSINCPQCKASLSSDDNKFILHTPKKIHDILPKDPHIRFHFLEQDTSDTEFLADFKLLYGINVDFLYHQISTQQCKRIKVLKNPYKQHFTQRFFAYQGRIGLDEPHKSK